MKTFFLFAMALFLWLTGSSQELAPKFAVDGPDIASATTLRISYFGNQVVYPGISVGAEQRIWRRENEKEKRNGKTKFRRRGWYAAGDLVLWSQPQSYSTQLLRGGMLWRKTWNRGFRVDAGLYAGLANRFNRGRTYNVDPSGDVSIKRWDSRFYFLPTLAFGIGKDYFYGRSFRMVTWHLRPNIGFWMPLNTSVVPLLALEAGVGIYVLERDPFKISRRK